MSRPSLTGGCLCGSVRYESAATVDLTVCSLDDPGAIVPMDHTWMEAGDALG